MDIQDLRIFARVAALQNLSAVGTELALTPGTISKRIQALEEELSVRLFDRTTRSIRITDEGATFLVHARRMLDELDQARASVADNVSKPKGKLKISAPASFAEQFVSPAICGFTRAYPEIDVQVDLTDRLVNLQEEGYDVAIRSGVLLDSSLIAKRLISDREIVVASPAYLSARGAPPTVEELAQHDCLVMRDAWSWAMVKGDATSSVRVNCRLRSNNGDLLRRAALDGLGVLRTSELRVRGDLQHGRLIRVLPDWEGCGDAGVWAVYSGPKHVLPKLRVLLDFLGDWFRASLNEMQGSASGTTSKTMVKAALGQRLTAG